MFRQLPKKKNIPYTDKYRGFELPDDCIMTLSTNTWASSAGDFISIASLGQC